MPGPEGYLPDKLQPKEPRLTVEQLQQKSLEIVAKAANLSNQYLERLGKDHVQGRLAGMGYSKEDIQPGGKIHDDILFRGGVSQTMALVSWALQRTPLEGPNDSPERTPHKLAEVMRPIDRAFTLAAAAIGVDQEEVLQGLLGGRTSIQFPPEERSAGLLQLREILRVKDPTIPNAEVAQRLLLLRQNLPLHIKKLEDAQFNSTDEVLRALSTLSIGAEQSSITIPKVNMTKQETSPVGPSMLAVRLPYRANHRKEINILMIEIRRSWGVTRKDVNHTIRALRKQKGRLSANEALAFASVNLKMRVLPRALANGAVSTAEIGDIPPLPDGREVIVGKHIIMDGDKQRVRYSYDIASSTGAVRSNQQKLDDEQLAREHIFQQMSKKWFAPVEDKPTHTEEESEDVTWLSILHGKVTQAAVNKLNIRPTDGRFVLATKIEEGTENGEATYSYDLSMPENKPDNRTPEQKERDRREALRRIHTAMMGRNQE